MGMLTMGCLLLQDPNANADPGVPAPLPSPGGGIGGGPGALGPGGPGGLGSANLAPGSASIFLCAGQGGAANVLGLGGGYCDFNFSLVKLDDKGHFGTMHTHCEWGGAGFLVEMWNCWRVFPGQPDHPGLPDPDIIPDGMGVPWAITGPTPDNQWPPPGLAPAGQVGPPPPPEPAPSPEPIPEGAP
jgi:hypothetical protein